MNIDAEEIMAFVDGELDQSAVARMEAAAASDPVLAAKIAEHDNLRKQLTAHFASAPSDPIPAAWTALINAATSDAGLERAQQSSVPISLADTRLARDKRIRALFWLSPWIGPAIAASLVLGMFIGPRWQERPQILENNGALVASGKLAEALDTQLAAAQNDRPIRMLVSFRRSSGDYCRVFTGEAAAGIACRAGNGWRLQELVPSVHEDAPTYRQAGSAAAELMAKAQNMSAGEPLDAKQEAAAAAHGWR